MYSTLQQILDPYIKVCISDTGYIRWNWTVQYCILVYARYTITRWDYDERDKGMNIHLQEKILDCVVQWLQEHIFYIFLTHTSSVSVFYFATVYLS